MERGQRDDSGEWYSQMKAPIAGSVSGVLTRAMTQPLDCAKVRHQLQVEPIKREVGAKYTSTWQTFQLIFREEGVKGLWKGHIPGQILSVAYGFGQFAAYDQFNLNAKRIQFFADHEQIRHSLAGGFGGAVGMIISTPFDVVRTRLIAQDVNKGYSGMSNAFRTILTGEGMKGLFRGLVPGVAQIAPLAAIQFWSYNLIIKESKMFLDQSPSPYIILLAGALSGIISKTCVYPLDLTKKRLQIQQFQAHRTSFGNNIYCSGLFDCMIKTARIEGFRGLYKGLTPSIIKSGTVSGLHFLLYEEILNKLIEFKKI